MSHPPNSRTWIRTPEAALHLGVAARTLANWRVRGGGPPFSRLGRVVAYDLADLDAWADSRRLCSTSARPSDEQSAG
jgi:predicted DNA-binding transcriptional regulator AlpA